MDELDVKGPLNGILSVHTQYPEADLLVLACDMINIKHTTLRCLAETRLNKPGFDFYAYCHEDFYEPLCAVYTSAALAAIKQAYIAGN